ncbi:hypothetical protein Fmac_008606 [Flemingia macrophylla]|uniref:Uncharacterized protein n=1 Tax=Flemingia macrophylla TaxID=520843 RepID=A0ABD1MYE6_9FABA
MFMYKAQVKSIYEIISLIETHLTNHKYISKNALNYAPMSHPIRAVPISSHIALHTPSTRKLDPSKLLTAAPPTTAVTPPSPASASPPRVQPMTTAGGCFDQRLRAPLLCRPLPRRCRLPPPHPPLARRGRYGRTESWYGHSEVHLCIMAVAIFCSWLRP